MEKVVIVTGAGRGIARRVALDFAAQGCRVALVRPGRQDGLVHQLGDG